MQRVNRQESALRRPLSVAGMVVSFVVVLAVLLSRGVSPSAVHTSHHARPTVRGAVVYPGGRPAEGVEISHFWSQGLPYRGSATDLAGKFVFRGDRVSEPLALLAMDRSREFGSLLVADEPWGDGVEHQLRRVCGL